MNQNIKDVRVPRSLRGAALALCLLASCVTSTADDPSGSRAAAEEAPQAQPIEPGPQHQALQQLVGDWSFELRNMEGGEPGVVSARGTGKIQSVLDGRYLIWNTSAEAEGGEVHGAGLLGYDLLQKQYEFLWVSGRTTGMPIARGEGVLMGRGIDFTIQVRDPRTGRLAVGRTLLRATDLDNFVMENYALDVSGELRVRQRTSYRRVGS
ncbi:MAG: DUF1579 family protein [Planctomycetes bacterium]|nr:DUF1579 family protein [Planctomycetota bacterium]MCB9904092.1 DUF1579 family protein [Planctomycetota bacterium]